MKELMEWHKYDSEEHANGFNLGIFKTYNEIEKFLIERIKELGRDELYCLGDVTVYWTIE